MHQVPPASPSCWPSPAVNSPPGFQLHQEDAFKHACLKHVWGDTQALGAWAAFLALPPNCVTLSKSIQGPLVLHLPGRFRLETSQGHIADATLAWSALQPLY